MNKTIKRVLIVSGALAVGTAVLGALTRRMAEKLVRIALDREIPKENSHKLQQKLTGESDVFGEEFIKAEKNILTAETVEVKITANDGTMLIGHWYPCNNAKRVIIAMHGWRSSWSRDFGVIADFWHDNDCNILFVEQRGQNNSGGDCMGFGLIERCDCRDWINWVNNEKENVLPIYLCGVSMGASTVLMASGLELPENVCGIIADCGYTSPHEIWKHVVENNLNFSYGFIGTRAEDLCIEKIQIGTKEYSTIDAMTKNHIPVLFIHGTDDQFVPIEMTFENYKACAGPKRLLVVPGAEHGRSLLVNKGEYENAVRTFWCDFDDFNGMN